MPDSASVPPLIVVLFGLDLALGALYIANYFAGQPIPKLNAFLDLNGEHNLPTWYSAVQWFVAAALLGLFASRHFGRSSPRSWALSLLPLVFLAMSLDEVAEIHEWIGQKSDVLLPGGDCVDSVFSYTGVWMLLLGLPFLAFFTAVIYAVGHYFLAAPAALYKIFVGVLIMLVGALGFETISNFVDRDAAAGAFTVLFEEVFELLGATVVVWGCCELLVRHGFRIVQEKSPIA